MAPSVTIPSSDVDAMLDRVSEGNRLSPDELTRLAGSSDILPLGMMADAVRRRLRGTTVTYLRVALYEVNGTLARSLTPGAQDLRVSGAPATLDAAAQVVGSLKALAGTRTVSGYSWADVEKWAGANGGHAAVLSILRGAGLDVLAEVPLDADDSPEHAVSCLVEAGFRGVRLTVTRPAPVADRMPHLMRAASIVDRFPDVAAVAPLPMTLNPLRPTTGYDDVKVVALARLVMPDVPHVQVDWLRYGPKLAQVALTFGADDLDNVSASDEAPDGRRRAPIEELRKNVESAGFTAVERDGRFATPA